MSADLGFEHVWTPGRSGLTLLLLHGTGGDERDLLPLGRALAPDAALLSPRGKVLEHGMPRFFRRLAEGVFDVADLKARAGELADFVDGAARAYGFDRRRVVAVGYSNGANVAAGAMLLRPDFVAGAALLRAMPPFEPEGATGLDGVPVLVLAGRRDPYGGGGRTERLRDALAGAGADVEVAWMEAGHEIGPADLAAARAWLTRFASPTAPREEPSGAARSTRS